MPLPSLPLKGPSEGNPKDDAQALKAVRGMLNLYTYITEKSGENLFDSKVMRDLSAGLKRATAHPRHPSVEYEILIDEAYTNLNGVLHGAAATLIFDMVSMSSLCPLQRKDWWDFQSGVSRSMNLSFLKACPRGTTVRVRSWVVQVGSRLALFDAVIESLDGESVYATCSHHKVNSAAKKEHLDMREEMEREMKRREEERGRGVDETQKAKL